MKSLIIYDESGRVLAQSAGEPAPIEPVGVPFLWVTIPEKKYVVSVDTSTEAHEVIFGDYPATEVETLEAKLIATQEAVDFLLMGGM